CMSSCARVSCWPRKSIQPFQAHTTLRCTDSNVFNMAAKSQAHSSTNSSFPSVSCWLMACHLKRSPIGHLTLCALILCWASVAQCRVPFDLHELTHDSPVIDPTNLVHLV